MNLSADRCSSKFYTVYALHISCAPRDRPRSKSMNLVRDHLDRLFQSFTPSSPRRKGWKSSMNFDPCVRFVTRPLPTFPTVSVKADREKIRPSKIKKNRPEEEHARNPSGIPKQTKKKNYSQPNRRLYSKFQISYPIPNFPSRWSSFPIHIMSKR